MKNLKKILLILFLLILLIYSSYITSIPKSIILFDGEDIELANLFGIYIKEQVVPTVNNLEESYVKKENIELSLFNIIPLKNVSVETIPKTKVVPLGNTIGLKLYTTGVLVVGKTKIEGEEPYKQSGIQEGDIIIKINEKEITCTNDLIECVNNSNGQNINVKYLRGEEELCGEILPKKNVDNEYKIGLWVRDGAAGIGTITYYDTSNGNFGALGHGIVDIDTENLIKISSGTLVSSKISSIVKGEKDNPGEIKGSIINGRKIGEISKNTQFGIYGEITNLSSLNISSSNEIEVASRNEIKEGNAKVILNIEDGVRKEYDIKITKIFKNNNYDNKSMQIEICDENLLSLTGGIVQGMSGAPIVQNNKFVGAVTHVLVSDPTKGYAIFGDLMVKEMREVK